MTNPDQQYNNPEEQVYHEESNLTKHALEALLSDNSEYVDTKNDEARLHLVEPLTDAKWSIEYENERAVRFERYSIDDRGKPTQSGTYYFDQSGNLRGHVRDYTMYPTDEKLKEAGMPPKEDLERLTDDEKEELFKVMITTVLKDALSVFSLEKDLNEDIVEPEAQQELRKQLAAAVPRI